MYFFFFRFSLHENKSNPIRIRGKIANKIPRDERKKQTVQSAIRFLYPYIHGSNHQSTILLSTYLPIHIRSLPHPLILSTRSANNSPKRGFLSLFIYFFSSIRSNWSQHACDYAAPGTDRIIGPTYEGYTIRNEESWLACFWVTWITLYCRQLNSNKLKLSPNSNST